MPAFFNSPYFVPDPDNWHLKPGAPKEIQEEFEAYMKACQDAEKENSILD